MEFLWTVVLLCVHAARGCRDTLWFQATPVETLTTFRSDVIIAQDSAPDAAECARRCNSADACKSALFEPDPKNELLIAPDRKKRDARQEAESPTVVPSFSARGICTLLPGLIECKGRGMLISSLNLVGHSSQKPVYLHCFYCAPWAREFSRPVEDLNMTTVNNSVAVTTAVVVAKNAAMTAVSTAMSTSTATSTLSAASMSTASSGSTIASTLITNLPQTFVNAMTNAGPAISSTTPRLMETKPKRRATIKVMTFNTWQSGAMVDDGIAKIAKHIIANDPDIVFLQELYDFQVLSLRAALGTSRPWRFCTRNNGAFDYILTKHRVMHQYEPAHTFWNNACSIRIRTTDSDHSFVVNAWNVHLFMHNYGPYATCSSTRPVRSAKDLYAYEYSERTDERSRLGDMLILLRHEPFLNLLKAAEDPAQPPLIMAGDFNSPSHLDWTEETKEHHCQFAYEWPVSKMMHKLGFVDSYRAVNTDPTVDDGSTWSSVHKNSTTEFVADEPIPEPQDRIDFIYFKGPRLRPVEATVYAGTEPIQLFPDHRTNDWPSDHKSVITTFEWV